MADHKVSRAETTEKQRIDTDPSKKREYMESAAPSIDYLVDPERFSTPTMGDFYLGAVDGVYLKKIDELAKKKLSGDGNDKDAAFYVEAPPVKEMGHENNVYYLKAHVSITDDDIHEESNYACVKFKISEGDTDLSDLTVLAKACYKSYSE